MYICMFKYFWFIGIQVLKQNVTILNMYQGSEWRNKLKFNQRHENHDARTECDETTKRIRLEGKNLIYLLMFFSMIFSIQAIIKFKGNT